MVHTKRLLYIAALSLLHVLPFALSHGDDHGNGPADMQAGMEMAKAQHLNSSTQLTSVPEQSYFAYPEYGGLMLAHIGLMTIAWFFILPIGEIIFGNNSTLIAK